MLAWGHSSPKSSLFSRLLSPRVRWLLFSLPLFMVYGKNRAARSTGTFFPFKAHTHRETYVCKHVSARSIYLTDKSNKDLEPTASVPFDFPRLNVTLKISKARYEAYG